jgi:peptide/nickel transport system permease protein
LRSINSKEFWAFSIAFIVILVLVSIFAYILAPDNSENANQMHLSIHSKPPGFNVNMLSIPLEERQEDVE